MNIEEEIRSLQLEGKKRHLNVVFIGYVDAGKSTVGGQILFLTGQVDDRTIRKFEKEAKENGRESWYMAFIMDINEGERVKGITIEVGRAEFETETTRYSILDAPGHKGLVLNFYGTGMYGLFIATLYESHLQLCILVRGYAGWNSRRAVQVLEQVFPKDATVQPSLVIVYFGGNDSKLPNPLGLGAHVPLAEYVENMRKIATHLQSLSDKTRIIFLSAPPINEEQMRESCGIIGELDRTNKLCKIYSDACVELCREMDIKRVDMCTSIQKKKDWESTCFIDGIHFTSEGSKFVAEEILKVLKEADWEPSLQWSSLAAEFGDDSPYDPVGADGKTVNVSEDGAARLKQWGISNGNY